MSLNRESVSVPISKDRSVQNNCTRASVFLLKIIPTNWHWYIKFIEQR